MAACQTSPAVHAAGLPFDPTQVPAESLYRGNWTETPRVTIADAPQAMLNGVSGEATVGCTVAMDGRLTDCRVLREAPQGRGFGPAAVRVASRGRVVPPGPEYENHPRQMTTTISFNVAP